MIENLNGIHETVNYRENTNIRLYDNIDYEEYPPHWHTVMEMIMPLRECYPVTCGDCSYTLQEHEILLICPGVLHHMPAVRGERIIFQAEPAALTAISEVEALISSLSPGILITETGFPEEYPQIRRLMEEIVQEYTRSAAMFEAVICAKVLEILAILSRSQNVRQSSFEAGTAKQSEYTEKFLDICNYINDHYGEDLTLEQAADRCGFSKYHFSRLFKQYAGVPFYKYLNQKRIARAQQMLIDPSVSITDVALSCGYASLSSFIRMFKIVNGCTPSQFRSLYQATLR